MEIEKWSSQYQRKCIIEYGNLIDALPHVASCYSFTWHLNETIAAWHCGFFIMNLFQNPMLKNWFVP